MVAIILVNYNGAMDTIDCIRSLSAIENVEKEIVVVDNKSTDHSLDTLKEAQKKYAFTILEADENRGFSAGNNIGIEYSMDKGADYFLLLNNDTVVEPGFLEALLKPFENDPSCGATTSRIFYYSNSDVLWYGGGSFNHKLAILFTYNYPLCSSIFLHRGLFCLSSVFPGAVQILQVLF